jgi:hypothetical protein
MMKVENEFIECKQDAIIENAEIVSYKILIEIAKKVNGNLISYGHIWSPQQVIDLLMPIYNKINIIKYILE